MVVSGGACVNVAAIHASVPSSPFGGVGNAGNGAKLERALAWLLG